MTNSSPSLRLFELLEIMCTHGRPFSLADAIEATGWPKPSVHRMLGQLESGGLLAREPDGRRYTPAPRLLRLAESTLSAGTQHGVRHAVLRQLVADIGESCNLTALSGAEVIYLDRVESAFPLRMELRPGTRVPIHCSASGKLFLAHLSAARRAAILDGLPLTRHTATTLTDRTALEAQIQGDPWLLPSGFCFTDVYLAALSRWAQQGDFRRTQTPRVERIAQAVAARPALAPIWRRHYQNEG